NIAHGEHARTRGFEQVGRALEWPLGRGQILLRQVRSRFYEAFLVENDTAIQPSGIRLGPGHQEHVSDVVARYSASAVSPLHTFKVSVSFKSYDLGSRSDLDG